jgi:hypothetical protein
LIVTSLGACGWSQPARAQLAEEAAGTFSAAAATLAALHEGKLTRQYAAASFEAFREQATAAVEGIRSFLIPETAEQSLDWATAALRAPCFDPGCDWEGQLESLRGVVRELLATAAT